MPLIWMAFMSMLSYYVALYSISRLKYKLIEFAAAWSLTAVMVAFLAGHLHIYEMFVNLGLVAIFTIYVFIKLRNITLSILFSTTTSIIVMAADNIAAPFMLFIFKIDPNNSSVQIRDSVLYYAINSICVLVIAFTLSSFLGSFLKDKLSVLAADGKSDTNRYIVGGALITLGLFYANIFLVESINPTLMIVVTSLMLVGYMVFMIAAVSAFINQIRNAGELAHQQEIMNNLKNYTSNIEGLYNEMRRFRHDYVNILASVYGFAENNENEKLKTYLLDQILPESERITQSNLSIDRLSNIKLQELKGLLSLKLLYAQSLGIHVCIEVANPVERIDINMVDLCRITGILMDNAIEACAGEGSSLSFTALTDEKGVTFIYTNTVEGSLDLTAIFQKGYSTKGKDRGLGLNNLRAIVGRYANAALSACVEGGQVEFHLYISSRGS